jgi:hypothetical protein
MGMVLEWGVGGSVWGGGGPYFEHCGGLGKLDLAGLARDCLRDGERDMVEAPAAGLKMTI